MLGKRACDENLDVEPERTEDNLERPAERPMTVGVTERVGGPAQDGVGLGDFVGESESDGS